MKIITVTEAKGKSQVCEKILRSLPQWFGIESAIVDYVNDVQSMETLAAEEAGEVIGFLSFNKHNNCSAEIHVMGVLEKYHRKGIGQKLVARAEDILREQGLKFLTVKTLSASRASEEYDRTRKFYLKIGFSPVEEFKTLWGEANPCLFLLKELKNTAGVLHHINLKVSNLQKSSEFWGWFLSRLGYVQFDSWSKGVSWKLGETYIDFVQVEHEFLNMPYQRDHIGLNHLAFQAQSREQVDAITVELRARDIKILYIDKHPFAGGPNYYAVYFEDYDGFKGELVAP
jgi:ribosomal protein S18 acetylase RimI-like enzyme/catechol 2,3-dioxygenase-like lactoylglutathione lyase family enzyme